MIDYLTTKVTCTICNFLFKKWGVKLNLLDLTPLLLPYVKKRGDGMAMSGHRFC